MGHRGRIPTPHRMFPLDVPLVVLGMALTELSRVTAATPLHAPIPKKRPQQQGPKLASQRRDTTTLPLLQTPNPVPASETIHLTRAQTQKLSDLPIRSLLIHLQPTKLGLRDLSHSSSDFSPYQLQPKHDLRIPWESTFQN